MDSDEAIRWTNLSPRLSARWRPAGDRGPGIRVGYSWYRHRLLLDDLAVGDPHGLSGSVYRWDDVDGDRRYSSNDRLTFIGPVGPCCAGALPNTIDPSLKRPTTREFVVGVEQALGPWRLQVTGLDRREHDLIGLVNVGVTAADYTVSYLADPGVDILGNSGVGELPVYDRQPSSFGADRYELTNVGTASRYQGVDIALARPFADRWALSFGGTAYRAEGTGGSLGYQAVENDQGVLGDTYLAPNATTNAYGRLFFDRAYAIKLSGAYRAPGDLRLAVATRYQDGQPFARVVVAEGLRQGAELVQAYPRGGQRFTFMLTMDVRVEKDFTLGRARVGIGFDVFNLLDTANEVEEDIVTGPAFRTITAVQPPRALRLRLRVGF